MEQKAVLSLRQALGRWLLWAAFLVFLAGLPLPAATALSPIVAQPGHLLSIPNRVACQTTIERIYWQHRSWPAANPSPKPAFEQLVPTAAIEAKVGDTLALSAALAEMWQRPITAEMLQAEIERQANASRQPALLQEIWAALGNDPVLVAECLARPALAARLARNWFSQDERFTGRDFNQWRSEVSDDFTFDLRVPAGSYTLPTLNNRAPQQDDTWRSTAATPLETTGEAVWTGAEMLYLGNFSTQGFRYNPATDTWDTMTTINAPPNVYEFTAVWTGTEMITWGGCDGGTEFCTTNGGGRYNPATDTWTATNTAGAPLPRRRHGAVWTGVEMIVWGGCRENSNGNQNCITKLNSGGRYNPTTDAWQPMTTANAPTGRDFPELIWTGQEMLLWSGTAFGATTGGRYDPATDTWQDISTANAPTGRHAPLVWTGTEMIAWGGCTSDPLCDVPVGDGGRYDPATDTWTPVSSTNAPSPRLEHGAVWTGSEMIVWGGNNDVTDFNDGGRYNPATDTWQDISTANAPLARSEHQFFWTGSELLIWGGVSFNDPPHLLRSGGRYNPVTDSWVAVRNEDPFSARTLHTAVWTGVEMIAWGGIGDGQSATGLNTGRIYDPITDTWDETSLAGAPTYRFGHSAVWTGTEMIVWGGNTQSWPTPGDGGRYNPATDTWTPTNTAGAPEAPTYHSAVWTGSEMIIFGGSTYNAPWDNVSGRYNPTTDTWTPVSTTNLPEARRFHSAVWTGSVMIIWAGGGALGVLGDGSAYDPTTDTWTPINTINAPIARFLHTTVWTGSEMIIWGGTQNATNAPLLNTGGRYNPTTDTWTPTSTTGTPEAAARLASVWTGDEMIVWGGCVGSSSCPERTNTGGRYNPQSDSWQLTTLVHVPDGRSFPTAVWTGSEMIVWGGLTDDNNYAHTGGRYYAETSGNNAPTAADDAYTTDEDTPLTVDAPGVLANDQDADGDPLTAELLSSPANGTLTFNGDGSFTYTPNLDFNGTDTFTYRATDGMTASNVATVTLTVTSQNDPPLAQNDAFVTAPDGSLTINTPGVLVNDSDKEGDPLSASLGNLPSHGTLTFNDDGSFTYTAGPNAGGTDAFTYLVSDGQGGTATATVTLFIGNVNTTYLPAVANH